MDAPKFLGVYSGSFEANSHGKDSQKKQYWYVWYMLREQRYIISNLDSQQKIPASFITPLQFGVNLKEEKEVRVPEPQCPDLTVMQFYSRQKVELKAETANTSRSAKTVLKSSSVETANSTATTATLDSSLSAVEEEKKITQPKAEEVREEAKPKVEEGIEGTKLAFVDNKTVTPIEGKTFEEIDNTRVHISKREAPPLREDFDPEKEKQDQPVEEQKQQSVLNKEGLLVALKEAQEAKDSKELRRENAKALRIDKDIRQDLANALDFWKKGKKGVASVKIDALLKRKDDYVKAHKHTFTECAIQLRKINQNEAALAFAIRCTEVAPEDSHTFFNAARMYFELKNYRQALDFVQKAIKIQPNLEPAIKLNTALEAILAKMSSKTVL